MVTITDFLNSFYLHVIFWPTEAHTERETITQQSSFFINLSLNFFHILCQKHSTFFKGLIS